MGEYENKRERRPLWRRVRDRYDRATLQYCRMESMGARRLVIQGCREILEYGRSRICLGVRDPDVCRLSICGHELSCLSYHADAVIVEGDVRAVYLSCGEPDERGDEGRETEA